MARFTIPDAEGRAAVDAVLEALEVTESATGPDAAAARSGASRAALADLDRNLLATAVRYTLQQLEQQSPGNTLEVRVPPFGAVQCVEGPRHTRGTPPNVVETDPETWMRLSTGRLSWSNAVASGRVHASGTRANLEDFLPQ